MSQSKHTAVSVEFDDKVALLKAEFGTRIPEKIATIESFFSNASTRPAGSAVDPEFVRYVHSFVGAAGCMGFHDLSRKARDLEQHLGSENDGTWNRKSFDDRAWSHIFALKQMAKSTRKPQAVPTSQRSTVPTALPMPMLKILVASDDPYTREIVSTTLRADGHSIIAVENGAQALAAYTDQKPDLVLLDVVMPLMDGYEATRRIKQTETDCFTPVIFVTSLSDRDNLLKCIECGGDDFIIKPFDFDLLKAKVFALDRIRRFKMSGARELA